MTLRGAGRMLSIGAALAIAVATLTPSGQKETLERLCLACGELGSLDVALNIMLFIPLGLGLQMGGVRRSTALWAMCGATVMIELVQLLAISGRDASVGDIIANAAGGTLGLVLGVHGEQLIRPRASLASILAGCWLVVWVGTQVLAGLALRSSPPPGRYFGQHMRPLGDEPQYEGRMLRSALAGRPFPDWELPAPHLTRATLGADSGATMDLLFESEALTARYAPIARILDAEQREALAFGADGTSAIFSVRTRASDLRLRPLQFRLRDVLPRMRDRSSARARDTVEARARYARAEVTMHIEVNGHVTRSRSIRVSTSAGWRLLAPVDVHVEGSRTDALLDGAWLAGWLAIAGYWLCFAVAGAGARRARSMTMSVGAMLTIGIGLIIVPRALHMADTTWWEAVAALAGVAAGCTVAWSTRRRSARKSGGNPILAPAQPQGAME